MASDHPKTMLGLPEVQLGLLPGAGGSNRLPRLIGVRAALDIILAGKNERAKKAFTLGMVDELVPESILLDTAIAAAERLARGWKPSRKGRGLGGALLDGTPIGRLVVYGKAKEAVTKKTGGNYPAPLRALEVVRTSMEQGMTRGLEAEAQAFGELATSSSSSRWPRSSRARTSARSAAERVPAGASGARECG